MVVGKEELRSLKQARKEGKSRKNGNLRGTVELRAAGGEGQSTTGSYWEPDCAASLAALCLSQLDPQIPRNDAEQHRLRVPAGL